VSSHFNDLRGFFCKQGLVTGRLAEKSSPVRALLAVQAETPAKKPQGFSQALSGRL
jgi:hypothetical protein